MSASSSTTSIRALLMRAPSWAPAGALALRGLAPCCFVQRQVDAHARAAPGAIVGLDVAAVLLDDLAHDREPEPGAPRLGRHVRVEDLADQLALEARARCPRPRSRRPRRRRASTRRVVTVISPSALALERLDRVGEQVVQQLPQAARVGHQLGRAPGRASTSRRTPRPATCARYRSRHLGHELVQVDARPSRSAAHARTR